MLINEKEQSAWLKHILIIEAIALAPGSYLIATTILISRDATVFVDFAKSLSQDVLGAMLGNFQHPGYPLIIYLMHGIIKVFFTDQFWAFLYSAQIATLICRMGALLILYFIGRNFVGQRMSFWAVLIITLMPESAQMGSDALSDWPHLFVLSAGILVLIKAFEIKNPWLFGGAGLLAGIGYLIRPECAQLVIYASLFLLINFLSKNTLKQKMIFAFSGILLIAGFGITAGPYMKLKGAMLPKKAFNLATVQNVSKQPGKNANAAVKKAIIPLKKIPQAVLKLVTRICELLVYFFAFFIPVGMWQHFRKDRAREAEKFLMCSFVALNVSILIWLFCRYDYLSRRHAMPLTAFMVFYVPIGIQTVANWISGALYKNKSQEYALIKAPRILFCILMICGLGIADIKIFQPLGSGKSSYRDVAAWLEANTEPNDVIVVPDLRISFYAKRSGIRDSMPDSNAKYIVKIVANEGTNPENMDAQLFSIDEQRNKKNKLTVCRLNR